MTNLQPINSPKSNVLSLMLPLKLTLGFLVVFFAAHPSMVYGVKINVTAEEYSALGSKGDSLSISNSTYATTSVLLGDGFPTFRFPPPFRPFTAPIAEAVSFGNKDGTFGGYVNTTGELGDSLGQSGAAHGVWSETYVRDANTTEIPFDVFDSRLMLIDASVEHDPNPAMDASLVLAIFLSGSSAAVWVESVAIGAPNGQFEITDPPENLKGDFTVYESPVGDPPIDFNDWYAEYIFDVYEGSIDISHIGVNESFDLDFVWAISANQGDKNETGAYASFNDPVDGSGGVSFDLTGLTPISGGSPVPPVLSPMPPGSVPSPVPEPSTLLLMASGLIGLGSWKYRTERKTTQA